jgi:hypothetical protein
VICNEAAVPLSSANSDKLQFLGAQPTDNNFFHLHSPNQMSTPSPRRNKRDRSPLTCSASSQDARRMRTNKNQGDGSGSESSGGLGSDDVDSHLDECFVCEDGGGERKECPIII